MVALQTAPPANNFILNNHDNMAHELDMMMGENGILLGFTGDVWNVSCVRYVLWLQRQAFKLSTKGVSSALIVPNRPYELNGFFMSIPREIPFPLLADPTGDVYEDLGMAQPGYVLLSRDRDVLGRWQINDSTSLSLKSVLYRLGK